MHDNQLFHLLHQKATLITPNTRLAQYFHTRYRNEQIAQGCAVFEMPKIFSYDSWLKDRWKKLGRKYYPEWALITNQHVHVIWDEIIREYNPDLFHLSGLIQEIKKAWKLCCAWEIDVNKEQFIHQGNMDTAMFFKCVTAYKKRLNENHWVDVESLPDRIQKIPSETKEILVMTGFDHLPTRIEKLFQHLGSETLTYDNQTRAKSIAKTAFVSEEEELNAVIEWVKKTPFLKKDDGSEKNRQYACIIPNITEKRKKLDRILRRYFHEQEYNISAGYIFSECTMISQALKMLALHPTTTELKDVYFLMESPYFGRDNEEVKRSKTMKAIHAWGNEALPLNRYIRILKENEVTLADHLESFFEFFHSAHYLKKQKPSDWIAVFQSQLEILGWPGIYGLNSQEYQTHQRWLALLNEYQQMDLLFEKVAYLKAVFLLKQMAGQVMFQPQKKEAHVHFLGLLEASGLQFDGLWVTGMNDDQFPGKIRLNPFIPHAIQRKKNMPHATPAVEIDFARSLKEHFMCGADEVMFSYLEQKNDSPAFESPLMKEITCIKSALKKVSLKKNENNLEYIPDSDNIPCMPDETIRGGTTLIQNQALCPFRAFAKHRLRAEDFESLDIGLNERVRGNLVHDALEKLWKKAQSLQNLLAYSEEDLKATIHESAFSAVQAFAWKKPDVLSDFLKNLEVLRLEQLLLAWLNYEKSRPDFMVDTLEKSKSLQIADLEIHIRADRVDRLPSGEKLVIDYKTGSLPSLSDADDRPENPQLLLYALSDPEIKAWTFAQIKPALPLFKGKSAQNLEIAGIKTVEWEIERSHWQTSLEALANAFIQGDHAVSPKKETTCARCDLQGICRIMS